MGKKHRMAPEIGAPILRAATSWMECRLAGALSSGAHTLIPSEVVDAGEGREVRPLTIVEAGFRYGR